MSLGFAAMLLLWSALLPGQTEQNPEAVVGRVMLHEHLSAGIRIDPHIRVDISASPLYPADAWNRLASVETYGDANKGFTSDIHYAGVTFHNETNQELWFLEITNPHLNGLRMWVKEEGQPDWVLAETTGRLMRFDSRQIPHFAYVLQVPVSNGASTRVLLELDKRGSSISYPMRLWQPADFFQAQQFSYVVYGMYFGVFVLILFIIAIAFLVSFRRVYLWYFLYALSLAYFIFNDIGLAQQFIYPGLENVASLMRVTLTYFMVVTFNFFAMEYFNTREQFVWSHRVLLGVVLIIFIHASIYFVAASLFRQYITILLQLLYLLISVSIVTALITAVRYIRVERYTAYFFIAGFAFMFLSVLVFFMGEFGWINQFSYLFTPIQLGYAFEILFISGGLAWQVRAVENRQKELNRQINVLETEKLRAYIDGSEIERNRIAMDLHDDIGNRLASIKRTYKPYEQNPGFSKDISDVIRRLRRLSHRLAPPSAGFFTLPEQIAQLVDEMAVSSSISYSSHIEDVPDVLGDELSVQLYRIVQEAVENIEKHSRARNACIQLIGHPGELVLTIEDDGIGIEQSRTGSAGIGLTNIRRRCGYIGADVSINSLPGKGLQIMIVVPMSQQTGDKS